MKQTYPGDCRAFDPDTYIGCNGRFFRPVSADFDGRNTTISYERVPMEEMPARFGHLIDEAQDRMALAELFGGAV